MFPRIVILSNDAFVERSLAFTTFSMFYFFNAVRKDLRIHKRFKLNSRPLLFCPMISLFISRWVENVSHLHAHHKPCLLGETAIQVVKFLIRLLSFVQSYRSISLTLSNSMWKNFRMASELFAQSRSFLQNSLQKTDPNPSKKQDKETFISNLSFKIFFVNWLAWLIVIKKLILVSISGPSVLFFTMKNLPWHKAEFHTGRNLAKHCLIFFPRQGKLFKIHFAAIYFIVYSKSLFHGGK